jgi:two-component system response regulator HydG
MDEGRFREDLYYRLNVVNIDIPPLRDRLDDVPLLAEHFLKMYRESNNADVDGIASEALDALCNYEWPGNVRELENVIERAVVLDTDGTIGTDDLPDTVLEQTQQSRSIEVPLGTPLEDIEQTVLRETLRMTDGDKKLTAKLLGIATRTVYRKLNEAAESTSD